MKRPALAIVVGHGLDALVTAAGFGLTHGSAIEANPILRELAAAVAFCVLQSGSSLPAWTVAGITVGIVKIAAAVVAAGGLFLAARFLNPRFVAAWGYALGLVGLNFAVWNVAVLLR